MRFAAIYKRKEKTLDKKFNKLIMSVCTNLSHLNRFSADYAPFHFSK